MTPVGLRVCMVGPHYPRPGGMSTQVELLSACLRADGVEVRSVDTNVQALRRFGWASKLLLPPAQVLAVTRRLGQAASGADLIHVHLSSYWGFYLPLSVALGVGRQRRLPVVATYHGGKAPVFVSRQRRAVHALLSRTAALIVLTRYTAQVFEGIGLQPVIVPNLVDVERFRLARARRASCGDGQHAAAGSETRRDQSLRILWIKDFNAVGNPQLMLRVFAQVYQALPQARLTMIGAGELLPAMQAQAGALGLPVEFTGRVPFTSVQDYYAQADLFVSTSAVDNQPSTLLEASASGLPIVATAVGGVPEVIDNGVNGLLAPSGDADVLAAAILRLAQEPELAARLGQAALRNADRFAWPAVRGQLAQMYRRVCDKLDTSSFLRMTQDAMD